MGQQTDWNTLGLLVDSRASKKNVAAQLRETNRLLAAILEVLLLQRKAGPRP